MIHPDLPRVHSYAARRLAILFLFVLAAFLILGRWAMTYASKQYLSHLPVVFNSAVKRDKGLLEIEDLTISHLAAGRIDHWSLPISAANHLTVTLAPAAEANMLLSVVDDSGLFLVKDYDMAPAGEVETIVGLPVDRPGIYQIQIFSDLEAASDYAFMVLDEYSYNFQFRGILGPGRAENDAVASESDHFWFFSAAAGDFLSLQVAPEGNGDVYLEIFGPDSMRLFTIDENDGGEAESLVNYPIVQSGMYGIRVGEFDFNAMAYTIVVQIE